MGRDPKVSDMTKSTPKQNILYETLIAMERVNCTIMCELRTGSETSVTKELLHKALPPKLFC